MTSSKHNLAIHKWGNLKALVEFANMGDTTERWLAFQKRWPDVFPTEFYADSENELRRNAQRAKEPMRSKDAPWIYAMTSRGIAQRRSRPAGEGTWIDYAEPRILLLRDTLRRAWAGGPDAGRCMEELLGLRPFPGESLDDPSSGVSVDWHRAS